jgi:catechol 2,3-dioxygenase-like lactoylglutathione lyase family enzyme
MVAHSAVDVCTHALTCEYDARLVVLRLCWPMVACPADIGWGRPVAASPADNGVSLDFAETSGEITAQHYAFLVGEEEFDAAFGRIRDHGLPYWADPGQRQQGAINRRDGGRGLYFEDPDGHLLEILTRPYGSGTDPARRTP